MEEWHHHLLKNNFFEARSVQIAIDEQQLSAASGSDASPDHHFAQRKAISLSDTTVSIAFPGPSVHMSPAIMVEETELTHQKKELETIALDYVSDAACTKRGARRDDAAAGRGG